MVSASSRSGAFRHSSLSEGSAARYSGTSAEACRYTCDIMICFGQPLQIPVVLLEADGQVVEQFRMGGLRALRSEIVHGADDAFAEVPLPNAIHEDARRPADSRGETIHLARVRRRFGAVPFRMLGGSGNSKRLLADCRGPRAVPAAPRRPGAR